MAESSALRQDRGGQNILLFFVVFLCILYIIFYLQFHNSQRDCHGKFCYILEELNLGFRNAITAS